MPNTNAQTIHQMGGAINAVVKQATGRQNVENIDMDFVTVAQNRVVRAFTSKTPYLSRRTGGGMNIGRSTLSNLKQVVGGTLAWNQLVGETWKTGTKTFNTTSVPYNEVLYDNVDIPLVSGHKYFQSVKISRTISDNDYIAIAFFQGQTTNAQASLTLANGAPDGYAFGIYSATVSEINRITINNYYGKRGYSAGDTVTYDDLMFIDLTVMFGTAIADYIYNLEQANSGAGVEWFTQFFKEDYYEYDPGTLKSVQTSARKTTGPDWEQTYPLDSSLILRGIPKLDSNNSLYYDGDVYKPDGTVTRRYGIVDLGTLPWTRSNDSRLSVGYYFYGDLSLIAHGNTNKICTKYPMITDYVGLTSIIREYGASIDKVMFAATNNSIYIIDSSYTDSTTFKRAMSGVYVVYELATPTTETAEQFTNPQEVSIYGTEEFITSTGIPVGNDTEYYYLSDV